MRTSDICLSIRSIKVRGNEPGSENYALELIDALRATRLEWSYIRDRDLIARIKARVPVFVAALNTITPPGHAVNFEGDPIIAPWMTRFGTPARRQPYICQNNPIDLESRVAQAVELMDEEITDSFQFDDWNGNAQMLWYPNTCFCDYCQQDFARELGLSIHYRDYLRGRGFTHTAELFESSKLGNVPLWEDYLRFQQRTVTRFFRALRTRMDQALGRPVTLSVNGSVLNFGGDITTIRPFISYLNGETRHFAPADLLQMAERSRDLGVRQVVSFFPDVVPAHYHAPEFVARVRQAIALCYCLGLLPLFPYDVYTGNDPATGELYPRWFGTTDEFLAPYAHVREHPHWFDAYQFTDMREMQGTVVVESVQNDDPSRRLRHTISPDGHWQTTCLGDTNHDT